MLKKFPNLCTPIKLAGVTFRNRIFSAPMGGTDITNVRRHGAIPSLELSHSGMYAGTYMTDKEKQKSMCQWEPSNCTRLDGLEVRELTQEMIDEIVAAYGKVAGLAKCAGFEMLTIHGGHGWLINQFLSPYFNHRTDNYGGSIENRCRFVREVLQSVREAVGKDFPIEFRFSGSELFEGGYDLNEGIEIAKNLESYMDLLHVEKQMLLKWQEHY